MAKPEKPLELAKVAMPPHASLALEELRKEVAAEPDGHSCPVCEAAGTTDPEEGVKKICSTADPSKRSLCEEAVVAVVRADRPSALKDAFEKLEESAGKTPMVRKLFERKFGGDGPFEPI